MRKRVNRDDIRLEPKLGSVEVPQADVGLRAEKPIKKKSPSKTMDKALPKQELEIKRSAIVLASFLLVVSTVIFAFDQLFNPDSFEIEELKISADFKHLTPQQIRSEILPLIQNNYFAVDLKKVEQSVEHIDWVDQVSVRREWPKSIHIRLTEHNPIAYWGKQGYLNDRAESFNVDKSIKINQIPYLFGPDGTQKEMLKQYASWKKLLSNKALYLESLIMTPRYAYEAKVKISRDQQKQLTDAALMTLFEEKDQPVPVLDWRQIKPFYLTLQLGKNDMESRLQRFTAAFPDAFKDQILKVDSVDLRYPNGFAVRWNENDLPQDFLHLAITVDEKN